MWRKKKVCGYWDCQSTVPHGELLCTEHKEKWTLGLIDRCPGCRRFKDIMYYVCQDCYIGRKVKTEKLPVIEPEPEQKYQVEYSKAWTDGFMSQQKRFVYIIGFYDGPLHIGETDDIGRRLSEIKEKNKSAGAKNPGLDYLETAVDLKSAELRVDELKQLINSNPSQIHAMTLEFHSHMREFFGEEF